MNPNERPPSMSRRRLLLAAAAAGAAPLAACASAPSDDASLPPIVFVPGNGDTAALWMTTIWRFESNGWPRERLHAIDMPYPLARDDDTKAQPGRTSTSEAMAYLAAEVRKVLAATGASKVALVGNSRGGYAIRNFIANGGGAAVVSHAVLGGTPNHGVFADPSGRLGSEFNGAGPFLARLNAPQGPAGNEVTPGIRWMTIRSDNNDKYAQPDGVWIGARGMPTHVTHEGPALKGAENVVLAGVDHRETSFSPPGLRANLPLHCRPRAGDPGDRSRGLGRPRRHGQRPRPRQPARRLRDQPAAGRRDGRGLRDEPGDRRAPRRQPGCARRSTATAAGGRFAPTAARPTSSWSPRRAMRRRTSTARRFRARRRS